MQRSRLASALSKWVVGLSVATSACGSPGVDGGGSGGGVDAGSEAGDGGNSRAGDDASAPEGSTGPSNPPGVTVDVSPVSATVNVGGKQTFTCTVHGAANNDCTWTVTEPGGGSIVATGGSSAAYTAPAAAGTYHVVAASQTAPAVTGTSTVVVLAPTLGDCNALPAAGTWENVTPAALNQGEWCTPYHPGCPDPGQTGNGKIGTYGTNAFVLDPGRAGTIVLGTSQLGMWKSDDCGSTWAHVDTGQNAAAIDGGRNWTMVVDPTDGQVLYTVAGYGQGGVFKSVGGAVDWTQVLPQSVLDATAGGFVEKITMDPTDHRHLLVSFHAACTGTPLPGAAADGSGGWGCLAESIDAGENWTLTTSAIPWTGTDGPGQTMIDAKTWFYASNSCQGLWRTTTGGVSPDGHSSAWTQVSSACVNGSVYAASNGVFFTGGNNVSFSDDGIAWTVVNGSPSVASMNGSTPMLDDGETLFVGGNDGYYTAPLGSGAPALTQVASTPVTTYPDSPVAYLGYDAAHHVLYTSNLLGGFWRYRTQ